MTSKNTSALEKTLLVVTGPTASGKSALSLHLAKKLATEIISADSRQLYRDIPIATAAPSPQMLAEIPHHLVGTLALDDYYSAARFEEDALALLPEIWKKSDVAIVCGGSMMYVDALTYGIDSLPDIDPEVRRQAYAIMDEGGIEAVAEQLHRLDPDYWAKVDRSNHKRMIHAIEVSMQAGRPYSSLLTGHRRKRPFRIIRTALCPERDELFGRINRRVDEMISAGLEDEARRVYPMRHYNSLNTVGLKEMFAMFDGQMDRPTAIARIAKNTRVYAKKQLTWLKKSTDTVFVTPDNASEKILRTISTS